MPNLFNRNDGTFAQVDIASLGTTTFPLNNLTNASSANVSLTTTSYFDGPAVSQGSSGTWYASGTVTLNTTSGGANFFAKLWDGTTTIASAAAGASGTNAVAITLSGALASPAGNLRMSAASSNLGSILFNNSGNSKDSTVTAVRIG
jgi:hypothetical protein